MDQLINGHRDLLKEISSCTRCQRRKACLGPVLPAGSPSSPVVIQGRDPGKMEDLERRPFSERAPGGRLLNRYLQVLGISRTQCYITNTLFCYSPQPPALQELSCCLLYKPREFSFLSPKVVLLLGNDAYRSHITTTRSVMFDSGVVFDRDGVKYIPLIHPGQVVRSPSLRERLFRDLIRVRSSLEAICLRS